MNTKKILAVLSFFLLVVFLTGCNQESQVITPDDLSLQKKGQIDAEIAGLTYMLLAEKLAHDVYTTLGLEEDSYPAFLNISDSEENYMGQILALLDKYGVDDPIVSYDIGVFTDYPDFETDYVTYTTAYTTNPLQAGIEIEEFIIAELNTQLAEVVKKQDIINVYNCLLISSAKHQASFTKENIVLLY